MFLTSEELIELTGKKRRQSQVEVLRQIGIEHRVRPDGFVLVMQTHVEKVFDGAMPLTMVKSPEPNWSAINGTS